MHDSQHDVSPELQDPGSPLHDPVPPLAREVLALYRGPLAEVCFPDLDRVALDAAADELLDAQRVLEAAERALEQARSVVAERTATLQAKAQRGLAYARIFAEDQPELKEQVAAISATPRRAEAGPGEVAAPKRRGRPRKTRDGEGVSLFGAEADADDPSGEAVVQSDAA